MRVNYQGLLNQTLGAVGSTMSTLKFLHSQDPKVIKEREIETQKETDARRQKEYEDAQKQKEKERVAEVNALKAERHKTIKDIKVDEIYDVAENMPPSDINDVKYRADKLNNEYAKLRNISSHIYDLEPNSGNSNDEEFFDTFAAKKQDFLQQRIGDKMASSLFEKMLTTRDQEEAFKLKKEYLADRAKRGPDIENKLFMNYNQDLIKRLPDYANRRAEEKKLFEKGVKKK